MIPPSAMSERRARPEIGARRVVWPHPVRLGYRILTTRLGIVMSKLATGLLAAFVLGWLVVETFETMRDQVVTETVRKELRQETEQLDRRLERVEDAIEPVP